MSEQTPPVIPRLRDEITPTYKEPLTPTVKRALLVLVIFFHVGGGWALTQVEPAKLIVGDVSPMEVRLVAAEPAAQPEPQLEPEKKPELPNDEPPRLPEFKPPPELATAIAPPPPDLPPPEFPVEATPPPPPPEKPKPPPEKPKPPPPRPVEKRPPAPAAEAAPQQAKPGPPAATAAPKTVSASQLTYLVAPNPIYPARSRRAGEQGAVMVRALIDVTGRPAQVSLLRSSGYPALDKSAVSAVRAAQFRPYAEGGLAQAVWVHIPINFVLR